jgi:hypothetical protein
MNVGAQDSMDDDDALQALNFAMELERQREIEARLLRADPAYAEWLNQLEKRSEDK